MADLAILMKTMEHFAAPKKTKAQLEAEKILKEEQERQAKMKKAQAGTSKAPAAPAKDPAKDPTKAPVAPTKAPVAPTKAPAKDPTKAPVAPPGAPKKDEKKGAVKKVLEKFQIDNNGAIAGISIASLIEWLVFILAAYLSWTCNSKNSPGMDVVEKAFRAFVAGIFGLFYLIAYFFAWADQCKTAKKV